MLLSASFLVIAAAAAGPPVVLDVDDSCTGVVSEPELRHLLTIELQGRLRPPETDRSGAWISRVECRAGGEVEVSVVGPRGPCCRATLDGSEPTRDVPRLLAIAIAERLEEAVRVPGEPGPVAATDAADSVPAGESSALARVRLELLGGVRPHRRFVLYGGAVGASLRLPSHWMLSWELSFDHASLGTGLGHIAANLGSAGMWAGGAWSTGGFLGEVGVGARVGLARLTGRPEVGSGAEGAFVQGPWIAASAQTRLGWRILPRLDLFARLEAGYAFTGLVGEISGGAPVVLQGFFGTASVGVGGWL